jgi:hypothetical protein
MPACRDYSHAPTAGVRKAPRHEVAGGRARTVQRALWDLAAVGNLSAGLFFEGCIGLEGMHNFGVLARVLPKRGFNVVGPCDFK